MIFRLKRSAAAQDNSQGLLQLRRKLAAHVLLNNLQLEVLPLSLCVVGPTGEGKTFNIKSILADLNVRLFEISSSALAHHKEGMALYPLIRSYRDASSSIDGTGSTQSLAAVLIDDIDRSIASGYERAGHTVHSQLVTGLLMDLCDNPYSIPDEVTRETRAVARVPLIFTANRIDELDSALRRPQRMTVVSYRLSSDDRLHILRNVFYAADAASPSPWRTSINSTQITELIERYPNQPVAFFADIVSQFWADIAMDFLSEQPARFFNKEEMKQHLSHSLRKLDLSYAIRIADRMQLDRSQSDII